MEYSSTFLAVAPDVVRAEFISTDFLLAFGEEVGVTSGEMSQRTTTDGLGLRRPALGLSYRPTWHSVTGPKTPAERSTAGLAPGMGPTGLAAPSRKHDGRVAREPVGDRQRHSQLTARGEDTVYQVSTKTRTSLPRLVAGKAESTIDKELVGWILDVQSRVLRRRLGIAAGG